MVDRSRKISLHGQEVNIDFWMVKNLDPGRERMYRVNGSDLPLMIDYCIDSGI